MIWGYCSFLSLVESDDDCDFFMWLKQLNVTSSCDLNDLLYNLNVMCLSF